MKTNKAMKNLLQKLNHKRTLIVPDLQIPMIIKWEDCILLHTPHLKLENIEEMIFIDKTDIETSNNHLHLEEDLTVGLELLNIWKTELISKFSDRQFILILSSDLKGRDIVVRFYQYRSDEPEWIDRENLDNYKEEAILIIELMNETR